MKLTVNKSSTPKQLKKFVRTSQSLSLSLLQALNDEIESSIDNGEFDFGVATPLVGADLDYRSWLKTYAPSCSKL